jgi:hypothetical protein
MGMTTWSAEHQVQVSHVGSGCVDYNNIMVAREVLPAVVGETYNHGAHADDAKGPLEAGQ